jgi:hypothetical protein
MIFDLVGDRRRGGDTVLRSWQSRVNVAILH